MSSFALAELGLALHAPLLVFLCVAVLWGGAQRTRVPWRQDPLLLPWALATAVAWHPNIVRGLLAGHGNDSLFTLPEEVRFGLIVLAALAGLVPFTLSVVKTRALRDAFSRRASLAPGALDLLASVALALGALALAPPLFRAYCRWRIPELPAQHVAERLPSLERLGALARPLSSGSLTDHAAALFLWTIVIASALGWLLDVRRRRRPLGALQAGATLAVPAALWSLGTLAFVG